MTVKKRKYHKPLVSIVIPAFRSETYIQENLNRVKTTMDKSRYRYEIICVVDGKVDNTFNVAQSYAKKFPRKIKVSGYLTNLGKGHAVRFGMAQCKGEIIAFIDAGLELHPRVLLMGLEHMDWYGADIIVGSKRHLASKVNYPWQRRLFSMGYQLFMKILFGLQVRDTQLGMKLFKREVLEKTLPRLLVKRYAFDIEMLTVAKKLGFKRMYESPIELEYDFKDLVHASTITSIFNMAWDSLAVFYRLKILKYYDDSNKKNWITPKYLTFKGNGGDVSL